MFMCNLFDIIYLYNDLRSWLPFSYAMAAVLPSTHMLASSAFGQLSFTKQSCLNKHVPWAALVVPWWYCMSELYIISYIINGQFHSPWHTFELY